MAVDPMVALRYDDACSAPREWFIVITDFRFCSSTIYLNRRFTFLALLTLALGIGLNTAIFSLINDCARSSFENYCDGNRPPLQF